QLSHALPNHWAREASYSRNCRNSASADRLALRSCHQTSRALIQNRSQRLIARLDPRRIDHCVKYTPKTLFYGNVISRQILSSHSSHCENLELPSLAAKILHFLSRLAISQSLV